MCVYKKEYAALCNDVIMDVYALCNDFRRFGAAALELCYLAAGRCDLYFELRLFPWDFAAASVILREAGGYVGSLDGDGLALDRPVLTLAANSKESYDRLRAIVKRHIRTVPYEEAL